jgi:hypothetical protein
MIYSVPKNCTAVQGIPIGQLNVLRNEVSALQTQINIGQGAFPQMTTVQRMALVPISGQTAYDTTIGAPYIYVGGAWYSLQLAQ